MLSPNKDIKNDFESYSEKSSPDTKKYDEPKLGNHKE